jgi:hypothetical protein
LRVWQITLVMGNFSCKERLDDTDDFRELCPQLIFRHPRLDSGARKGYDEGV